MIKQELALKLAASGCTRRWDPQVQVVYDDSRAPARYLEERLRRYDRQLFLRFNALAERWELFRWRGLDAPSRPQLRRLPAEEVARRSMFLWTVQEEDGSYLFPDMRTLRKIQDGDCYARCGSSSAEALDRKMREEDRKEEEADRREREQVGEEYGRMMAHELRKYTGRTLVHSHAR